MRLLLFLLGARPVPPLRTSRRTVNSVPCAVQQISVPILIGPMGGYCLVRDNEIHYEEAKSQDKDVIVFEGAVHSQRPCTACETTPGRYSNTVENFYNHARDWMNARFAGR